MNMIEAIKARHSVRAYKAQSLAGDVVKQLQAKIDECNRLGQLHIQLVQNEPKAFESRLAKYGKFSGVSNYLIMAGAKSSSLGERIGYYGEQIVLLAQTLGLNTCWVGLTYNKVAEAFTLAPGEKVACCIAIGYGQTPGVEHKIKSVEKVSNADAASPAWFRLGVEAALLAPTAINQQRFSFQLLPAVAGGKPVVKANHGFSLVGYTHIDLGIAKCHFEIGAGKDNFRWAD